MKTILPLLLGILVFTFTGCNKKKKELKIPTDVAMKMDINRSQSPSNGVRFTSGKIFLSDFSVEGEREEGEDIAFTKTFSGGLWINFDRNKIISSLDFDIPQGNYYRLEIDFSTKYNNGNNTIELNGTYTDSTGVSIPLIFEYNSEENFEIEGESDDGSATIILDKNNPETTLILLDPVYWFEVISTNALNNADKTTIDNQQVILINRDVNSDIYDNIVDRIDDGNMAIWD